MEPLICLALVLLLLIYPNVIRNLKRISRAEEDQGLAGHFKKALTSTGDLILLHTIVLSAYLITIITRVRRRRLLIGRQPGSDERQCLDQVTSTRETSSTVRLQVGDSITWSRTSVTQMTEKQMETPSIDGISPPQLDVWNSELDRKKWSSWIRQCLSNLNDSFRAVEQFAVRPSKSVKVENERDKRKSPKMDDELALARGEAGTERRSLVPPCEPLQKDSDKESLDGEKHENVSEESDLYKCMTGNGTLGTDDQACSAAANAGEHLVDAISLHEEADVSKYDDTGTEYNSITSGGSHNSSSTRVNDETHESRRLTTSPHNVTIEERINELKKLAYSALPHTKTATRMVINSLTVQEEQDDLPIAADYYQEDGTDGYRVTERVKILECRLRLENIRNRSWCKRMQHAEEVVESLQKEVFSLSNALLKLTSGGVVDLGPTPVDCSAKLNESACKPVNLPTEEIMKSPDQPGNVRDCLKTVPDMDCVYKETAIDTSNVLDTTPDMPSKEITPTQQVRSTMISDLSLGRVVHLSPLTHVESQPYQGGVELICLSKELGGIIKQLRKEMEDELGSEAEAQECAHGRRRDFTLEESLRKSSSRLQKDVRYGFRDSPRSSSHSRYKSSPRVSDLVQSSSNRISMATIFKKDDSGKTLDEVDSANEEDKPLSNTCAVPKNSLAFLRKCNKDTEIAESECAQIIDDMNAQPQAGGKGDGATQSPIHPTPATSEESNSPQGCSSDIIDLGGYVIAKASSSSTTRRLHTGSLKVFSLDTNTLVD